MDHYKTVFKKIDGLTAHERDAMTQLYLHHYDGSSAVQVLSDLANKTEVLLVYCDHQAKHGMRLGDIKPPSLRPERH